MGCNFGFGDDYDECENLIDEYQYLLELEEDLQVKESKKEKHNLKKDIIKTKIRNLLIKINENATGVLEIDKLQRLNEKYQDLLIEDSKIKNEE